MIKYLFCLAVMALGLPGCRTAPDVRNLQAFTQAVEAVREDRASCLLVSGGRIIEQRNGRGLGPLLDLYDAHARKFSGGMVADKVIGRAAAFILLEDRVCRVYGRLMSEDAKKMLEEAGIRTECDLLVPRILNRDRSGLCPLEQSVLGITDRAEAMSAIRRRLQELRGK